MIGHPAEVLALEDSLVSSQVRGFQGVGVDEFHFSVECDLWISQSLGIQTQRNGNNSKVNWAQHLIEHLSNSIDLDKITLQVFSYCFKMAILPFFIDKMSQFFSKSSMNSSSSLNSLGHPSVSSIKTDNLKGSYKQSSSFSCCVHGGRPP